MAADDTLSTVAEGDAPPCVLAKDDLGILPYLARWERIRCHSRIQFMGRRSGKDADELRESARVLRQCAREADLPGYAGKMMRAADDLERHGAELETQSRQESAA